MNTSELNYFGQDILIAYLKERKCKSYKGFLDLHYDDLITSSSSFSNWKKMDNYWAFKFLREAESLGLDLDEKLIDISSPTSNTSSPDFTSKVASNTSDPASISKIHNLRKRQIIDYNENQMAKKNKRRQFTQSNDKVIQSAQSKVVQSKNENENEQEIDNLTNFDLTYHSLNPAKMWTLKSSGRIVEKVIYEYAQNLPYESYLHSFIINDVDKEAESLFQEEEWEEIFSFNLQKVPKIDKSLTDLMKNCNTDRKKIGKKGDGIFRLKGNRLEIGGIEAGRKWEGKNGRKYLRDSLKLGKMLRDMLVQLIKECNGDEQIIRKLQTVGMLHNANRFQLLTMDIPNGYICRIKRFDIQEVAGQINNPPLAFVIKDILRAKAIMMQTLELVQEKKSNLNDLDDFDDNGKEVNRSEQYTTHQTITLSETHKTPSRNFKQSL
ncbi:hypothetical protein RhiirC2_712324 [Rhizophagus irregularis]|uniref:Uncharacterized protein n=1 Tax=Rhizophagus irregularis TaxID=588596 RepID=A0A2N1N7S8_9GLOM|nr:hypothetical protein RhiirC2_712324 [Rhizophagus irregularis]